MPAYVHGGDKIEATNISLHYTYFIVFYVHDITVKYRPVKGAVGPVHKHVPQHASTINTSSSSSSGSQPRQ
jgi:hypothetical protein